MDLLFDLKVLLVVPEVSHFPFRVVLNRHDEFLAVDKEMHSRLPTKVSHVKTSKEYPSSR